MPAYDKLACPQCGQLTPPMRCVQCLPVTVARAVNNTAAMQPVAQCTVPGGTWKDGELVTIHYGLEIQNNNDATQFVPFIWAGAENFDLSLGTFLFPGQNALRYLMQANFRRVGSEIWMWDGGRMAWRTAANSHEVLDVSAVFMECQGRPDTPFPFAANENEEIATTPDFTADILLQIQMQDQLGPGAGNDYVLGFSPSAYKYNVA